MILSAVNFNMICNERKEYEMKKLSFVLVMCMLMGILVSCGQSGDTSTEDKNQISNSASAPVVMTKEKVSEDLGKMYKEALSETSAEKGVSPKAADSDGVPLYISESYVKELTVDNYSPYYDEFYKFYLKGDSVIESLVSDLPEKCLLIPPVDPTRNSLPWLNTIVILDPDKVSEEDMEDLALYLRNECDNAHYGNDCNAETKKFDERFADIGDVLIRVSFYEWLYFDVKEKTFEEVEYFEGYSNVRKKYRALVREQIQGHIDEVLTEDEKVKR